MIDIYHPDFMKSREHQIVTRMASQWLGGVPWETAMSQGFWELRQRVQRLIGLGESEQTICNFLGISHSRFLQLKNKKNPIMPIAAWLELSERQRRMLLGFEGPLKRNHVWRAERGL